MKKRRFLLILVLLGIFLPFCLQTSSAAVINIWGVESGDSKTYSIRDEIEGAVSGTLGEYLIQYKVSSISDTDSNNYTDATILMLDLSASTITTYGFTRLDTAGGGAAGMTFFWAAFIFGYNAWSFYLMIVGQWHFLLFPATFVTPNHGINWTAELNTINITHSFPDYTDYVGYDQGDRALITYKSSAPLSDATLGTTYNLSGSFIWDKITGWLVSVDLTRTYDASFGFTIHTIIEPVSSSIDTLQTAKDIFAWLGLSLGIAGVCFTGYVYKKMK